MIFTYFTKLLTGRQIFVQIPFETLRASEKCRFIIITHNEAKLVVKYKLIVKKKSGIKNTKFKNRNYCLILVYVDKINKN